MILKNLKYIFLIVVYLGLIIWTLLIIWASNKGFDLSDEGYYMYYFSDISSIKINISLFHLVQQYLLGFVNISIQNLRLERLVLNLITTLTLSYSLLYLLKHFFNVILSKTAKYYLLALVFSSLAITYAYGPATPSYNSFSYLLLMLGLSIFIFDIAKIHAFKIYAFSYFLIGFILCFLFLVKVSNALLFILLLSITFLILEAFFYSSFKQAIVKLSLRLLITFFSFFIFQCWIWGGIHEFITFLKEYKQVVSLVPNHNIHNLISTYQSSLEYIYQLFKAEKYLLLFLFGLISFSSIYKNSFKWAFISFLPLIYIVIKQQMYVGGVINLYEQSAIYMVLILLIIVVFSFYTFKNSPLQKPQIKQLIILYFFFFFPFIGILGTSNLINIQLIFYLAPWFVAIFIFLFKQKENNAAYLIISCIVLLSLFQSYDAVINHPYRINGTLRSQTEKMTINKNDMIYIDKQSKFEIESIKSSLKQNGFKKGDYLFTYSELTGFSYILDSPYPTNNLAWFFSNDEQTNIKILAPFFSSRKNIKLFFIIDERTPFSTNFKQYLFKNGFDITNDYDKSEKMNVHFENENYFISIYSPKQTHLIL